MSKLIEQDGTPIQELGPVRKGPFAELIGRSFLIEIANKGPTEPLFYGVDFATGPDKTVIVKQRKKQSIP